MVLSLLYKKGLKYKTKTLVCDQLNYTEWTLYRIDRVLLFFRIKIPVNRTNSLKEGKFKTFEIY